MSNGVKLSVKADMNELIRAISDVQSKMRDMAQTFDETATASDKAFNESTKKVTTYFQKTRSIGRQVLDQLKSDFKSLMSINALQESLKLSNQFRGSIQQTIELSDSIRKLGGVFGITSKQFVDFQKQITRGLGDLGLGSEVGSSVMEGLARSGTNVRGGASVTAYAQQAGALGQITGQRGEEGEIAKLLAQTMQARGMDPNDLKAMEQVSEAVRKSFNSTGATATQSLQKMTQIFTRMPQDLRKTLSPKALGQLMTISGVAGPNATKFLEEFMGASKIQRASFEAQGFKGVAGKEGINLDKLEEAIGGVLGRIGNDPRMAAQTLGISEEAAEGLVRLSESMGQVRDATKRFNSDVTDMKTQISETRGLGESFSAAINKTKATITSMTAPLTQGVTKMMSKMADTTGGSAALVAGGATIAALLSGIGLRGIGKALGGGMGGTLARGAAAQAITGKEVQPVYVVNAGEIGAGGALGALGGMGRFAGLARFGVAGAGLGLGVAGGMAVNELPGVKENAQGAAGKLLDLFGLDKQSDAEKWAQEQKMFRAQRMGATPDMVTAIENGIARGMERTKIQVDTRTPGLDVKPMPKRGGAQ